MPDTVQVSDTEWQSELRIPKSHILLAAISIAIHDRRLAVHVFLAVAIVYLVSWLSAVAAS